MSDQIILCPHCKKEIPLTEALAHQLEEKIRSEMDTDYKKRLEENREEDRKKAHDYLVKKITQEKALAQKEARERAEKEIRSELELQMKDRENEASDYKKRNEEMQKQLLELTSLLRKVKQDNETQKLEMQKKLMEEEEKIREEANKKAEEENHLKILEKEKQLQDSLKVIEELKRKVQQGSQQNQGEVLELEIEELLRNEFPYDEIKPVAKGIRGADVMQIIHDPTGRPCGSIIWESKQTKNWVEGWVLKLKEDKRNCKADIAILVTEALPDGIKDLGPRNGIWVTRRALVTGLAHAMRMNLINVFRTKLASVGKNEKMESLFNYINSTEFTQRIEAVIDSFKSMQDDLEKEKRWFTSKWAKQEKNIRTVIDQTFGLHGDLQGIIGNTLPPLKTLELEPGEPEPAAPQTALPLT